MKINHEIGGKSITLNIEFDFDNYDGNRHLYVLTGEIYYKGEMVYSDTIYQYNFDCRGHIQYYDTNNGGFNDLTVVIDDLFANKSDEEKEKLTENLSSHCWSLLKNNVVNLFEKELNETGKSK